MKIKFLMSDDQKLQAAVSTLIDLNLAFQQINRSLELKYDLSVIQWSLLKNLLDMPAVSPQALAKVLRVTPGTLTQALARLSRKKLLFMCEDPADARKKMISLTRLGKEKLEQLDKVYEEIFFGIGKVSDQVKEIDIFLNETVKVRL